MSNKNLEYISTWIWRIFTSMTLVVIAYLVVNH